MSVIANFDPDHFLQEYWQKKPLLIRQAFTKNIPALDIETLLGLGCEEGVESRLVMEETQPPFWQLQKGPFAESMFATLPQTHWTLLVQGLNKLLPEFDDFLQYFDFIPSWRLDDIMASYAAPQGSVGPHVDQYDVFLLQASGIRKWMIHQQPISDDDFLPDLPMAILNTFSPEQEWILEAGDMLYLPPGVAHYGIGMDDCMTFSIGFRAPSHAELLTDYIDENIALLPESLRYTDPDLSANMASGEMTDTVIDRVQSILQQHFADKEQIADWFSGFVTRYLREEQDYPPPAATPAEFLRQLQQGHGLYRAPESRMVYRFDSAQKLLLYVNGEQQHVPAGMEELAMRLCNQRHFPAEDLHHWQHHDIARDFLYSLYADNILFFEDE